MSGRHPRSITSAPSARKSSARARIASSAHLRSLDNLGEDPQRMARQIERRAGLAEKRRQVLQFIGAALEGPPNSCARRARSARQRPGTTTRSAFERARQPAHEDGLGHQRRDLHPHVEDRPVERRRRHAPARPSRGASQRGGRSGTERAPSCRDFASSLRDGFAKLGDRVDRRHAGETVPGARGSPDRSGADRPSPCLSALPSSSSGAVSQAKTMIGTRHFPAWAKTLVMKSSEIP